MNQPHPQKGKYPRVYQGKGFIIVFEKDYWMAYDPDDSVSGFILYNALTGKYHAWVSEIHMQYPQLARARYNSNEDCPVDENHSPKSEFMMLLALRARATEHEVGSDFVARGNRELYFRIRRSEVEAETQKALSESNWKECLRIARDKRAFDEWVGQHLVRLLKGDDAAESFMRIAKWIKQVEKIEGQEVSPQNLRFFAAVEEATRTTTCVVPCQKDVQAIYEKGLSANQIGEGEGFRSVMRRLHFDWLLAGGRGPANIQKKSGGRRKN